jgi:hypothetical protein
VSRRNREISLDRKAGFERSRKERREYSKASNQVLSCSDRLAYVSQTTQQHVNGCRVRVVYDETTRIALCH